MARKVSTRTVVNRKALSAITGGAADALAELGRTVIERANPPDATPFGEGLVTSGDWGVWAGSKKVAGTAPKPKAVRLSKTGVTLVAGFGFPGRFQELGTIRQPARPFLTPALLASLPNVQIFLKDHVRKALRGVQ